ncbi:hypothetical protein L6164_016110 [Bauhinia variegata]|uniref:Uncharacterized protein n=1 Tax=Bauhinia variegata TaxID=167791 RepID=A0ACB9NNY8_BAUVA|nr:hypothetical protein L6164_016110 [Bauhinia variegata]
MEAPIIWAIVHRPSRVRTDGSDESESLKSNEVKHRHGRSSSSANWRESSCSCGFEEQCSKIALFWRPTLFHLSCMIFSTIS